MDFTLEAPDGSKHTLTVPDGATPDQIMEKATVAKNHLFNTMQPPSTTTSPTTETGGQRAGRYVEGEANRFAGSAQNLGADVFGQAQPKSRSWGDVGKDALTVAGPVAAPELAAAGIGAGALTRAANQPQSVADAVNTATQLGVGGARALKSGYDAASGLKAAAKEKYAAIDSVMSQSGKSLAPGSAEAETLRASLEKGLKGFPIGSAERQVAKGLLKQLSPPTIGGAEGAGDIAMGAGPSYEDLNDAWKNLTGLRRASTIRGAIADASKGMLEPAESDLRAQADAAYRGFKGKPVLRGRIGLIGQLGGGYEAIDQARKGNIKNAAYLAALTAAGGMSPGQLAAAVKAGALPAAQAALATGGSAANRRSDMVLRRYLSPDIDIKNAQ